jgi:LysR family transcriptional regulator for metE and metH
MLTEAIVELVRAGVGVSALPRWTVARALRSGDLVALPFTKKGLIRKWGAATLKTSATQPPIDTLIDLIAKIRP